MNKPNKPTEPRFIGQYRWLWPIVAALFGIVCSIVTAAYIVGTKASELGQHAEAIREHAAQLDDLKGTDKQVAKEVAELRTSLARDIGEIKTDVRWLRDQQRMKEQRASGN